MADLGATVVRIERPGGGTSLPMGADRIAVRNRLIMELDLKEPAGQALVRSLIDEADVLVEGFRPGVAERLGLGPDEVRSTNEGLVYTRISGWGQEGPYSRMAGHDINYIGLTGVLAAIGTERPLPPLNIVGDYAGGALYAVIGTLAALYDRANTGKGRVVDAAMVDGAASLLSPILDLATMGMWTQERESNLLDGGAPFYRCYATSDDRFMAVGALEPVFYSAMLVGLGIEPADLPDRHDPSNWQDLAAVFEAVFLSRTQSEWCAEFDGTDACVTPVLSMVEAGDHPHNEARDIIGTFDGKPVPGVAPRMGISRPRNRADSPVSDILVSIGLPADEARRLESDGLSYWV
jgi:alpha-methylacyl-CoA racemase